MFKHLMIVAHSYFILDLFYFGFLPYFLRTELTGVSPGPYDDKYYIISHEFFILAIILALLNIFKIRDLPALFDVGMISGISEDFDANQVNRKLLEDYKVVPIFSVYVSPRLYSDESIVSMASGDTEICVLNPGSYLSLS